MKKFILKGYYSNITHRITLFLNCVHHLVFRGGGVFETGSLIHPQVNGLGGT